jgi:hypothetical protein
MGLMMPIDLCTVFLGLRFFLGVVVSVVVVVVVVSFSCDVDVNPNVNVNVDVDPVDLFMNLVAVDAVVSLAGVVEFSQVRVHVTQTLIQILMLLGLTLLLLLMVWMMIARLLTHRITILNLRTCAHTHTCSNTVFPQRIHRIRQRRIRINVFRLFRMMCIFRLMMEMMVVVIIVDMVRRRSFAIELL